MLRFFCWRFKRKEGVFFITEDGRGFHRGRAFLEEKEDAFGMADLIVFMFRIQYNSCNSLIL
jgi:hypothetical protein